MMQSLFFANLVVVGVVVAAGVALFLYNEFAEEPPIPVEVTERKRRKDERDLPVSDDEDYTIVTPDEKEGFRRRARNGSRRMTSSDDEQELLDELSYLNAVEQEIEKRKRQVAAEEEELRERERQIQLRKQNIERMSSPPTTVRQGTTSAQNTTSMSNDVETKSRQAHVIQPASPILMPKAHQAVDLFRNDDGSADNPDNLYPTLSAPTDESWSEIESVVSERFA